MRVMVGIDDSDDSFYALQWVLDNLFSDLSASPVADERAGLLTLVHLQQPFQPYGFPGARPEVAALYPTATVLDSVKKSQEQISTGILSLHQNINLMQIKAETLILEGNPKVMICEISEEMNVGLLIIGSRGLGKIKRALLGSVSDYCAHHAKCPTLIVKPPKEAINK
ncbi:universal stress protein PHOS34-like [Durio zibethinus]|uniref:Universal stress protein PHOS34-like n=1 Tax=Durio zibethinus TaxID=66656 RepID=A0A6P5YVD0_DURZI|nr:universal stress protein PHOS34-like [Durio zibethinus]